MTSIKKYTAIFGALMLVSTTQWAVEHFMMAETLAETQAYTMILGLILGLSTIKALAVSGWYMHLVDEPRSISYLALAGVIAVFALIAGAAYSIT